MAIAIASLTAVASGCGVAYQAGTRIKATRMSDSLAVGQTSPEVHHAWGEPDLRTYLPGDTEVWSYAYKPNSNDVAAALLYTSAKDGDKGTFSGFEVCGGQTRLMAGSRSHDAGQGPYGDWHEHRRRIDWERHRDNAGRRALLVASRRLCDWSVPWGTHTCN